MIALLQRVTEADIRVDGREISAIGPGMVALVAIERGDDSAIVERMADKLQNIRLFADEEGRMNRDIGSFGGEILLVPQFTLAADTASGNRPSFSGSAPPAEAEPRFQALVAALVQRGQTVATGRFGADMRLALVNDGPVTLLLRVPSVP